MGSKEINFELKNQDPDGFKFSIKIPNSITLTHYYNRNKKETLNENPHFFDPELIDSFLTSPKPMKEKLKVIMR